MDSTRRRPLRNLFRLRTTAKPADAGRLASVDISAGLPEHPAFGAAVFGPGISLPLLGQQADAACPVPIDLLPSTRDICEAERRGTTASHESATALLVWLRDHPLEGDAAAFGVLTEACVRAGRLAGVRADHRVEVARNALRRGVENDSCELQLMSELAQAFKDTGRFDLAAKQYESLVNCFRSQGFTDGLRVVLPQYAMSLSHSGNAADAQRALDEFESIAETRDDLSVVRHYRASALRFLYSLEERVSMYEESLALMGRRGGTSEGCVRVDLAEAHIEAGNPAAAVRELRTAIAMFDAESNALHAVRAHAALAVARCDAGELKTLDEINLEFDALVQLRAATRDTDGHMKDELNRLFILEAAGIWLADERELERLRRVCDAARRSRNLPVWAHALRLKVPFELAASGQAPEDCATLPELIRECSEVSALLHDVRGKFLNPLERARTTAHLMHVGWWRVAMLAMCREPWAALTAADSTRSETAALEVEDRIARASAPPDVRQREQYLIRALEATVDATESDGIRREIRGIHDSYRSAISGAILAAEWTVDGLREGLQQRNECLILFACHHDGIISIATDGERLNVSSIVHFLPDSKDQTLAQEIYQRTREFVWSISQAATGDQMQPMRHAFWLWRQLIAPHQSVVADRNLVLIADGALSQMPWAALQTQEGDADRDLDSAFKARWATAGRTAPQLLDETTLTEEGKSHAFWDEDWRTLPYLGAERQVRVATSLGSIAQPAAASSRPSRVVGLADPAPGPLTDVKDLVRRLRSGHLNALPGARHELAELEALFARSAPRVEFEGIAGASATRTALASLVADFRPDVMHLAAHGQADPDDPLRSRIFLAPNDAGDRADLTVEWLYANPLQTALAVLSCCETALGHQAPQENVIGIPRALISGGAREVVATLWRVPDDHRLMLHFYAALLAGFRPEIALAQAQRALIDESVHPVFWAGHLHYS